VSGNGHNSGIGHSNGIGHNHGPALGPGLSWRTHCWARARRDLLPNLPIEILRGRVRRARELGLEYKTYASVRASTGRDVIGFLFSSNALRAFRDAPALPDDRLQKLAGLRDCARIALVIHPLTPADLLAANPGAIETGHAAPVWTDGWGASRAAVQAALKPHRLPADGILLIGDTTLEREWSEAGRLAGYLSGARYFAPRAL
jgi:hypothetical protein